MASKGHDVLLQYHNGTSYTSFGGAKSCEYKIKRDMQEVSSPTSTETDTGDAKLFIPMRYEWEMSAKCILKGTNPRQVAMDAMLQNTLLAMQWVDNDTGETLTGSAYISDVGETATIHEIVTVNLSFQGTGALTYTEKTEAS